MDVENINKSFELYMEYIFVIILEGIINNKSENVIDTHCDGVDIIKNSNKYDNYNNNNINNNNTPDKSNNTQKQHTQKQHTHTHTHKLLYIFLFFVQNIISFFYTHILLLHLLHLLLLFNLLRGHC
eukprot:GHVR01055252.1.p1 GENE.GHVR01055252.1~~GHVR01055252.1.p1  ORF type:complete len:138 (+),score=70.24 GHVR01055252.1:38-415(+)